MLKRLWNDEGGAILSAELVLLMTLLVIGVVVGAKAIQMAVVTEMADVAGAIGELDQSYQVSGTSACTQTCAATFGTRWRDNEDQCDEPGAGQVGTNSQGVVVCGFQLGGEGDNTN